MTSHDDADLDATLLALGERLRAARSARGWSARALAERSGVSERFVLALERGRSNVSVGKLAQLAHALDVRLDALLAPADEPGPRRALRALLDACDAASLDRILDAARQTLRDAQGRASRVALLGLRGAGKSAVGRALASRLKTDLVELDALVEARAALPLADLFSLHGPEYYAQLERDCLESLLDRPGPAVIATGGGIVTHAETYALLRAQTRCVWLRARPETHWRRVIAQGDRRPMAGRPRAFEELCAILERRAPLYALAELRLDTDDAPPDALADHLFAALAINA